MTPNQIDLARRLVACPRWRWMPGMSARRWSGHGEVSAVARVSAPARETPWLSEGWLPDLTDPATLGCLLALVREAWNDPRIHSAPGLYAHDAAPEYRYQIAHWHVYSPGPYNALTEPPKCSVTALTEAGALVKALEAAP